RPRASPAIGFERGTVPGKARDTGLRWGNGRLPVPEGGRCHKRGAPVLGAEQASFDKPDEIRTFEKGRVEIINVGGAEVGRLTFEPGWRWSEHVKPKAGTDWCMAPHFQYHVSG